MCTHLMPKKSLMGGYTSMFSLRYRCISIMVFTVFALASPCFLRFFKGSVAAPLPRRSTTQRNTRVTGKQGD